MIFLLVIAVSLIGCLLTVFQNRKLRLLGFGLAFISASIWAVKYFILMETITAIQFLAYALINILGVWFNRKDKSVVTPK